MGGIIETYKIKKEKQVADEHRVKAVELFNLK